MKWQNLDRLDSFRELTEKTEKVDLKAVLAGAFMGRTIDFLEGRWKNDLWRP